MWNQIFGSKTNCTNFAKYPLWYAHYDGKQTFDDYSINPFGGWIKPTMKQYSGDASICGIRLDLSYY
jgi:GH25 family lysozyme M1 (1,4-beta-N-acetylmuramidase)